MKTFNTTYTIGVYMAQTNKATEQNRTEQQTTVSIGESQAYAHANITEKKRDIIEYIAHNPEATNKVVADAIGCSISYPSQVRDKHDDVIRARAEELGADLEALEESTSRRHKKRAESWSDLTEMQQETLARLAEERDPTNPSVSLREIIEDLSFDTHPAYVSDVKRKYADFAIRLQKAREMASESEDPFELVDDIRLDEEQEPESIVEQDVDVDEDSEIREVALTQPTIEQLAQYVERQRSLAEKELEMSDNNQVALGRVLMAQQIQDQFGFYVD